ncbi:MAG: preprotein translocase subunit SecG [Candidatus Nitrohelix vancouverensis]|uniref:Protein-export membrane protein SecG n=1 Tax=Candidatus Nitrohelix vancouverensis TaxID=2705534 RepID=A0A7T0G496_9BACT|nr:MAG: preprotein translocase subunit SecG [Candidatus Nitrohelix vancouverensis]
METVLTVLHVLATLFLILVILLQTGKGAAMGSGLGAGSSQTMFGSSGAGNFLSKLTAGVATLFLVTSLTLAVISSKKDSKSVLGGLDSAPVSSESGANPGSENK